MKFFKYLLFYILFFILLYFEDRISIFNISLSNIWKSIAVFIAILFIIKKKNLSALCSFDIIVILLSLSFLINGNGLLSVLDIEVVVLILILPVSYYVFYYIYKSNPALLKYNLLIFSTFLILTSIPFLMNIIQPINKFNDSLLRFSEGFQLYSNILIGFFKQPSISSKVFVFSSIIVLIFGLYSNRSRTTKLFFFLIFILGIYDVYKAFTRTGWVMLIVFIFTFYFTKQSKSQVRKILFIFTIMVVLFYIFKTNKSIQNRSLGKNINKANEVIDLNTISSGRNVLIIRGIYSVIENNSMSLFFGLGKKEALEKNHGALAHDRFVEIFEYGGIVTLILYLIYLFLLYKEIRKRKTNSLIYSLSRSLFLIMILALIPSHGLAIWANVIFGGVIALNRIEFENVQ